MNIFAFIDRTEPGSPTLATPTPTITSLDDPSSRSISQLKELGRTVYKDVRNEFYEWEPDHCQGILRDLPRPFPATSHQVKRVAKSTAARLTAPYDDGARWHERVAAAKRATVGKNAVVVSITHIDSSDGRWRTDVPIQVVALEAYKPHPVYESCPPISRSVLMDDAHEETLSFLPYADDERFMAKEYQSKFRDLEWETPFDPDEELIQIETVKRMYAMHSVEPQDITRMKMFKEIRVTHNTGLQWDLSQRDILHWPGASRFQATREKELPEYTPDTDDLRQRLMSNLKIFCPSINCLHSVCETHGPRHANSYIPSGKPQLTGKDLILSEGVPCGPDCFRCIQDFDKFMESLPPPPSNSHPTSSLDTLQTVLGIAPDLFPCQLAIICLRPCKQVFVQRLQLFPDHTILSLADTEIERSHLQPRRKARERPKFIDEKSNTRYELLLACAHPGTCTSNNCPCFAEKRHCLLMCRCGLKCERHWKSCSCTNGKCSPETCDCAKHGRECIPGICINCDAGGHTGRPCNNTRIQRMASKPVEIKRGTYGLGAFACQDMSANTYLGSYVGHIISHAITDRMVDLARHVSLNYIFEVSPDPGVGDIELPIFDAAHLGNATRFLNQSKDGKDNVDAKTMLVVGEHQIGFYTNRRVKAGEELFLNYGENYWKGMELEGKDSETAGYNGATTKSR